MTEGKEPDSAPSGFANLDETPGVDAWVHFTNPDSPPYPTQKGPKKKFEKDQNELGEDPTILLEIERLIASTQEFHDQVPQTIRGAIYSFDLPRFLKAFQKAEESNKIDIRLVHDGHDQYDHKKKEHAAAQALHRLLRNKHHFCGNGTDGENKDEGDYSYNGCIASHHAGSMHSKFFTFSKAKDPDGLPRSHVVWISSANLTKQTGGNSFNTAITIYGNQELYKFFNDYFLDLELGSDFADDEPDDGNDYYVPNGNGHFESGPVGVYISPEIDSDLVLNQLKLISPDNLCRVHVAQMAVSNDRHALVKRLKELAEGGCKIRVVAGSIGKVSLATLDAAEIPRRVNNVHDKNVLIYAKFAGSEMPRYIVLTGSHNWTGPAKFRNDEILLRLESKALYEAFLQHFNDAFDAGDKCPDLDEACQKVVDPYSQGD
ncbi:phospholipase D-like domain-containing protein [Nannocystis exedens]|nr:phospholipase D-like domain-containing protein [Nannocystis exedens]